MPPGSAWIRNGADGCRHVPWPLWRGTESMSEPEASHFSKLAAAGHEVIRGNYRAAAQIFDLTREGRCPEEIGELAEVFGFMAVKVEAREHALERALREV